MARRAEDQVAEDRGMAPELCQQLTLAILDHSADVGLRMIKTIRCHLDAWEAFLRDRQELVDHLRGAHDAGASCTAADPGSLNRRHWEAHGSELASFLVAHPIQAGRPAAMGTYSTRRPSG